MNNNKNEKYKNYEYPEEIKQLLSIFLTPQDKIIIKSLYEKFQENSNAQFGSYPKCQYTNNIAFGATRWPKGCQALKEAFREKNHTKDSIMCAFRRLAPQIQEKVEKMPDFRAM